jgi:serine/threonine-protein kinase
MGTVYRALQVPLGRTVAVKVLASRLASDPAFIERFRREARAAAALNHPNVVLPIDVAEHRGCHYISMEYVEGESLGDLLDREGRLPWRRAVEITRQVAAGLEHAHRRGLVHGDMKPENVLLERDGRLAKITDLGLARRHGAPLEESEGGGFFGTPYYVSPEQARGETALDGRADIYSLGATLWHLLVGVPPFEGPNGAVIMTKHAIEPVPDPRTSVTDCPDGLVAVMAKMMAKKAEDRYANCRQLGEDLDALLAGRLPAHAPPVGKQWARPDLDAAFSIPGSLEGDGSRGAASTSARLSPTGSRVRGPSASHAQGPSGSRARRSGLSSAAAGRSRHRPGRSGSPRAASSALWPWLVAGILALLLLALGLTWLLSAP